MQKGSNAKISNKKQSVSKNVLDGIRGILLAFCGKSRLIIFGDVHKFDKRKKCHCTPWHAPQMINFCFSIWGLNVLVECK
jgi:hypothetical protein